MSNNSYPVDLLNGLESLCHYLHSINSLDIFSETSLSTAPYVSPPDKYFYMRDSSFFLSAKVYYDYIYSHSHPDVASVLYSSAAPAYYSSIYKSLNTLLSESQISISDCVIFPGSHKDLFDSLSEFDNFHAYSYNINDYYSLDLDFNDIAILHLIYAGLFIPIGGDYKTASAFVLTPYSSHVFDHFTTVTLGAVDAYAFYNNFVPPSFSSISLEQLILAKDKYIHYLNKLVQYKKTSFISALSKRLELIHKELSAIKQSQPSVVETYSQYTWA